MDTSTTTYRRTGRRRVVPHTSLGVSLYGSQAPVVLPMDDEKSRIKVALDKLHYLKAGWDGLDALPVSRKVLSNVLDLLAVSDNLDWYGWVIEPNINGTIVLRSTLHKAGISLGNDSFSYYIKDGNSIIGKDAVEFSAEAVIAVMRTVNP